MGPVRAEGDDCGRLGCRRSMIEAFGKRPRAPPRPRVGDDGDDAPRHGLEPHRASELALSEDEQFAYRAGGAGPAVPFVEIRARGAEGSSRGTGTMGELEVRGVWIASAYYDAPDGGRPLDRRRLVQDRGHRHDRAERLHRDPGPGQGPRQVRRRVDLDRGARERADGASRRRRGGRDRDPGREVVERPLAVVVLREGAAAGPDELRDFLAPSFAKWWLPDRFEFVDELPKTAVGKFRKTAYATVRRTGPRDLRRRMDASSRPSRTAPSRSSRSTTRRSTPSPRRCSRTGGRARPSRRRRRPRARSCSAAGANVAFVAGADIKEFPSLRESAGRRAARRAGSRSSARGWTPPTRRSSPPSRASVSAAGSSSRCAATSASRRGRRLGQPEIKLGLIPAAAGRSGCRASSESAGRCCSTSTGEFVDAQTAYEPGASSRRSSRRAAARRRARDRPHDRRAVAARGRRAARARARPATCRSRKASPRGGRLPPLPGERGRPGGRGGVPREARAAVHRSVSAVVIEEIGGPEQLVLRDVPIRAR